MTGVIEGRFPQRPDLDTAAAIGGGIFCCEPRRNGGNFLLGLIAGHARLEPHIRFTPSRAAVFQFSAGAVQCFDHRGRHPKLHGPTDERPVKSLGCDPDNGEHHVFEALRLADDSWITLEAGLPKMIADHHDRMSVTAGVFTWLKAAAHDGMDSNRIKVICRDDASPYNLGALANAQGRARYVAQKESLTQGAASLHVEEIGPRRLVSLATHRSGQCDQALLVRDERIRPQENAF